LSARFINAVDGGAVLHLAIKNRSMLTPPLQLEDTQTQPVQRSSYCGKRTDDRDLAHERCEQS
jgi:hypothetical protein